MLRCRREEEEEDLLPAAVTVVEQGTATHDGIRKWEIRGVITVTILVGGKRPILYFYVGLSE